MAPKKRKVPTKKSVDTAPIPVDDEDVEKSPPPKKTKFSQSPTKEDLFQKPIKKQENDAQVARTQGLTIPVDDGCPFASSHRVHIDTAGVIYDASLNQTNIGGNNNKFYRIQILESKSGGDFKTWTRWGRVGNFGQSKLLESGDFGGALADFQKKFKDKSGNTWEDRHQPPKSKKYTFIERNYEPDSSSDDEDLPGAGSRRGSKLSLKEEEGVQSKLELPVQQLMQLIFDAQYFKEVMADMNYDTDKLPLGKLSKRTIEQGYEQLKALATLILDDDDRDPQEIAEANTAKEELSSQYYSYIPHNFGRHRPTPIANEEQLKREVALLDSLSDMKIAQDILRDSKVKKEEGVEEEHALDRQFAGLGLNEMTPLDRKKTEFKELDAYLNGTRGQTHGMKYKVEDIFRIERNGEFGRFDDSDFGKMAADRRLLWHGSRATNFGGILSQGLRIAPPEAPVSGYMFGKGVYLADMSSKSANYCNHSSSGDIGLLLLCEAELGKPMLELTDSDYNAGERATKNGNYSTWGKGLTVPLNWKDASVVHKDLSGVQMPDTTTPPGPSNVKGAYLQYNEYIAYDVSQIRMRYLFRVKMSHDYGY